MLYSQLSGYDFKKHVTPPQAEAHHRPKPTSSFHCYPFIIPRASLGCSGVWLSPDGPAVRLCLQRTVLSALGSMSSTALALLAAL